MSHSIAGCQSHKLAQQHRIQTARRYAPLTVYALRPTHHMHRKRRLTAPIAIHSRRAEHNTSRLGEIVKAGLVQQPLEFFAESVTRRSRHLLLRYGIGALNLALASRRNRGKSVRISTIGLKSNVRDFVNELLSCV